MAFERARRTLRDAAGAYAALAFDVGRVLRVLPSIEAGRRRGATTSLLTAMRMRGARSRVRSDESRARLARAIGWVDRVGPGGPNCLRRALLRVALDRVAANEPVVFGLNVTEATRGARSETTGHAWVGDAEPSGRYEVEFKV